MAFVVVGVAIADIFIIQNGGLAGGIVFLVHLLIEILQHVVSASAILDFRLPVTFAAVGFGFFETHDPENDWFAVTVLLQA